MAWEEVESCSKDIAVEKAPEMASPGTPSWEAAEAAPLIIFLDQVVSQKRYDLKIGERRGSENITYTVPDSKATIPRLLPTLGPATTKSGI